MVDTDFSLNKADQAIPRLGRQRTTPTASPATVSQFQQQEPKYAEKWRGREGERSLLPYHTHDLVAGQIEAHGLLIALISSAETHSAWSRDRARETKRKAPGQGKKKYKKKSPSGARDLNHQISSCCDPHGRTARRKTDNNIGHFFAVLRRCR